MTYIHALIWLLIACLGVVALGFAVAVAVMFVQLARQAARDAGGE